MDKPFSNLPTKPEHLREMVETLFEEKQALQQKVDWLQEQLNLLVAKQFGRSSEKAKFDHPSLFDEAEEAAVTTSRIG